MDTAHYTYRVSWSGEDGEFVATCLELPSLSWLAATQTKALLGLRNVVDDVVADLAANNEDIPVPLADRRSPAASTSESPPTRTATSP